MTYPATFRVLEGSGVSVAVIGSDPEADDSTIGTEANPAIQVAQLHQDGQPVSSSNRLKISVPPGTLTAQPGPAVITGVDLGGGAFFGFDLSGQAGQLFTAGFAPSAVTSVGFKAQHPSTVAQRWSVEFPALPDGLSDGIAIFNDADPPDGFATVTWVGPAPVTDGSALDAFRVDVWCTGDGTYTAAVVSALAVDLPDPGPVQLAPTSTGEYVDKRDGSSFEVNHLHQCDVIEVSNDINSGTGQPLTVTNPGAGNWAVVRLRVRNADSPSAAPLLDLPGYITAGELIASDVNTLLLTLTITGTSGADPTVILTYDAAYAA